MPASQEAWQSERTVRPRVPEDEGLVISNRAKQVDVLPMPCDVLQSGCVSLHHVFECLRMSFAQQ